MVIFLLLMQSCDDVTQGDNEIGLTWKLGEAEQLKTLIKANNNLKQSFSPEIVCLCYWYSGTSVI